MTSRLLLALCLIATLCLLAAWVEQLLHERRQSRTEQAHRRLRPVGPPPQEPTPHPRP